MEGTDRFLKRAVFDMFKDPLPSDLLMDVPEHRVVEGDAKVRNEQGILEREGESNDIVTFFFIIFYVFFFLVFNRI